jgi:hypothetical protein
MNEANTKSPQRPSRVFISYSHDSPEHRERVLALSERLRADGIETSLDQYVNGTPKEGWPRWMLNQLDWADFVIVICTGTYYRRFRGHEDRGKGKGVDWEGALITQGIYDARSATAKFVPVLFEASAHPFVPEPLRSQTFYLLTSEPDYQDLYDFLLGLAGVEPRTVGQIKVKPKRTGEVLAFGDAGQIDHPPEELNVRVVAPAVTPSSSVVSLWQEKLEYLQRAEAFAVDPVQKFALMHQIEEVRAKIAELHIP